MPEEYTMKPIARIRSVFPDKFGIPRQSGLAELSARIVFEPEYRSAEALRGLEGYSHLWLIWIFSESIRENWSPTVRPPWLGGNIRKGVFATRSPFRPNPVGLSSVRLEKIEFKGKEAPVIYVSGADLMDGTPIIDIKPYLAYTDSHAEAVDALAEQRTKTALEVDFPAELLEIFPNELRGGLIEALAQNPRPGYQDSPERIYSMRFWKADIHFRIKENTLSVCGVDILERK